MLSFFVQVAVAHGFVKMLLIILGSVMMR